MNLNNDFSEIVDLIKYSRNRAIHTVNSELINLYWNIGKIINHKTDNSSGNGAVVSLSKHIKNNFPGIKGFSSQNLWRMRQFYQTYNGNEKLSALTRDISWTSNMLIIGKTKSKEEIEFYLTLSIREKYSSRELERQIDSGIYERSIISNNNLSAVLRENYPDSKNQLKDNYILDFLALEEPFTEKDLQKGLVNHLKSFLLELGRDYAFMGEEFRLQVGNKDFYIDLLFFHRSLQCMVAFELKITDFKPEYIGKMVFYLEALDRQVKKSHEKKSVGIILCKSRDTQIVEYSLNRTMSPTMIAEYETKLIPKKVLEDKLKEFYRLANEEI